MRYVIFTCTLLGLLCLRYASWQRRKAGLPRGRTLVIDTHGLERNARTLYDAALALAGRPDYVVDHQDGFLPVEVKSRLAPPQPFPSHVLQLAAYCRLVEVEHGRRPPYGVLKYGDKSIPVDYTAELERSLHSVLTEMRQHQGHTPDRSHRSKERCASCGFREVCDQALA